MKNKICLKCNCSHHIAFIDFRGVCEFCNHRKYKAQKIWYEFRRNLDQSLIPAECPQCGVEKKLHGHHSDYKNPLLITWCCSGCHKKIHSSIDPMEENNFQDFTDLYLEKSKFEELLSSDDVSEILGLEKQEVYQLLKIGDLQGRKIGRKWIIKKEWIDLYLKEKSQ
jgi:excisionase family DNA binding protein